MIVIYRFRLYENIVFTDKKELYQLDHFKNKYTYPFKKLIYNKDRKAYRIYSQWVSVNRLNKLSYKVNEVVETSAKDRFMLGLENEINILKMNMMLIYAIRNN